jgi:hypothetical protein
LLISDLQEFSLINKIAFQKICKKYTKHVSEGISKSIKEKFYSFHIVTSKILDDIEIKVHVKHSKILKKKKPTLLSTANKDNFNEKPHIPIKTKEICDELDLISLNRGNIYHQWIKVGEDAFSQPILIPVLIARVNKK